MASFQAKIGLKRPRKRKNKNYRFVPFPTRCVIENSNKIVKKFKKLKNTIMASSQAKIGWKMPRKREYKERKREIKNSHSISFRSYPTRNRKFQKNSKKIQKYRYVFFSSQNR